MSKYTPYQLYMRQALLYPLTSPFLPPIAKVEKDFSYANGKLVGTLPAAPPLGLPRSGQSTSYVDYDDGYYEAGLPVGAGTRFIDNLDNTISDITFSLMWIANHELVSGVGFDFTYPMFWAAAISQISALNAAGYAGHTDWRLPNIHELFSIVDNGRGSPCINPLFYAQTDFYWSSTTAANWTTLAWTIIFEDGDVFPPAKAAILAYVRPVRGNQLNL